MDTQPPIPFTPVPLRSRRDGWTPERQRAFIALLAQGTPSNHAARMMGLSKQTAHALRRRPGAESFSAAWDAAIAADRRTRAAERTKRFAAALHGVDEPVLYFGRTVGHVRRYDNRLLCPLHRRRRSCRTESSAGARQADPRASIGDRAPRPDGAGSFFPTYSEPWSASARHAAHRPPLNFLFHGSPNLGQLSRPLP
jgi:hypothetical protein